MASFFRPHSKALGAPATASSTTDPSASTGSTFPARDILLHNGQENLNGWSYCHARSCCPQQRDARDLYPSQQQKIPHPLGDHILPQQSTQGPYLTSKPSNTLPPLYPAGSQHPLHLPPLTNLQTLQQRPLSPAISIGSDQRSTPQPLNHSPTPDASNDASSESSGTTDRDDVEGSSVGKVKKFVCTIEGCGKSFTTSGHLTRHSKSHASIKPFACQVPGCTSRFTRQDNMMTHYRQHLRRTIGLGSDKDDDSSLDGSPTPIQTRKGSNSPDPQRNGRDRGTNPYPLISLRRSVSAPCIETLKPRKDEIPTPREPNHKPEHQPIPTSTPPHHRKPSLPLHMPPPLPPYAPGYAGYPFYPPPHPHSPYPYQPYPPRHCTCGAYPPYYPPRSPYEVLPTPPFTSPYTGTPLPSPYHDNNRTAGVGDYFSYVPFSSACGARPTTPAARAIPTPPTTDSPHRVSKPEECERARTACGISHSAYTQQPCPAVSAKPPTECSRTTGAPHPHPRPHPSYTHRAYPHSSVPYYPPHPHHYPHGYPPHYPYGGYSGPYGGECGCCEKR